MEHAALGAAFAARGRMLYLVGGAVRDTLLGDTPHDADYTTDAQPTETKEILARLHLESILIGERFGTIGAIADGCMLQITTFRQDVYQEGETTRHPGITVATDLRADLSRRDFTINAIAQHALTGYLYDPFGGQRDIADGWIRATGDPVARMREDPLRMLRAVRFAGRFGFTIETGTKDAIQTQAHLLAAVSRERVRDELLGILSVGNVAMALDLLRQLGLLSVIHPALAALVGCHDSTKTPPDVWSHTLAVVATVPNTPALRLAALLHDVGKPATRTVGPDGRTHFFGHDAAGAVTAEGILRNLCCGNDLIGQVVPLVRDHMRRIELLSTDRTPRALRRFVAAVGPDRLHALFSLMAADVACGGRDDTAATLAALEALWQEACRVAREFRAAPPKSPLTGKEIMEECHIGEGLLVGLIKRGLTELVIAGDLVATDTVKARRLAREMESWWSA